MLRLLAATLALGACAPTPSPDSDASASTRLVDQFELVAFHREPSDGERRLHRWSGEVRVGLIITGTAWYRDDIESTIDALNVLLPRPTQLVVTSDRVTSRELPATTHLDIVVGSEARIRDYLASMRTPPNVIDRLAWANCFAVMLSNDPDSPQTFTGAVVMIDVGIDEGIIRHCVAQKIPQALGFQTAVGDPRHSVFARGSRRETLSESDEDLIRILYDPRLEPGMTPVEAMPIVRAIAAEIEADRASR